MPLVRLDHVNLRTTRLEAMKRFYATALGLVSGPRPNFSFAGAWLYCGDSPVVHLVVVDEPPEHHANLSLQHFALRGSDLSAALRRLQSAGIDYRVGFVRDFELCQVHVSDPDGNHLHLDYPLSEAVALGLSG